MIREKQFLRPAAAGPVPVPTCPLMKPKYFTAGEPFEFKNGVCAQVLYFVCACLCTPYIHFFNLFFKTPPQTSQRAMYNKFTLNTSSDSAEPTH